ncbi:hypothetical protein BGW41_004711 [Actinomortierella wolfii]|nr:hypothetical protein BGW41_004711 [Actinomortierella wolfii]
MQFLPLPARLPQDDQQLLNIQFQQPLHARMCGFGEKDRRPIDPPPIVQLIMEDDEEERREKEGVDSVDQQGRSSKKHGTGGKKTKKKSISEQWTCNDLPPKLLAASRNAAAAAAAASSGAKPSSSLSTKGQGQAHSDATSGNDRQIRDEGMDGVEVPSRTSASVGGSDVEMADADGSGEGNMSSRVAADSSSSHGHLRSFKRHRNSSHDGDEHGDERDELSGEDEASSHLKETSSETQAIDKEQLDDEEDEEVDFLRHDPLFVLHASLWSEDGTQVRSMIATPSQQDPPKLTRILMGSIVVSPTLLNNTEGEPGWYFSFPDLSIRTEGIYTLKFSLIRFGSFNFNVEDGGQHASDVIDEAISQPFTVFSAKKFPGMTESTELSKTFAKQGLKIPIRNDLRVRKADRE